MVERISFRSAARGPRRCAPAWTLAALCALAAAGAGAGACAAEAGPPRGEVRDPYYGQTLFDFYQDRYFSALTGLMASQQFARLPHHTDEAEILRGGLYLSYGLHRQAADIFTRLIDAGAPPAVRDRAWYYLAKIRYQRGLLAEAEQALDHVRDPLPGELQDDRLLLQSNLLMRRGDFDGAARLLEPLVKSESASQYARFNLGVALIKSGAVARGTELLDEVGVAPAKTEELRALRDKANVALGFTALQGRDAEQARFYLERVRLNGMLANKALLGYGWAADSLKDPKTALVSWMELATRDPGDAAVLESRLAIPYALAEIGDDGQALAQYGAAITAYDEEGARLDESIAAIRAGKLLDGLLASNPGEEMGWFWNIDQLPELRHGTHLVRVLADHDFQEGFKNYRDLLFLARNLRAWEGKLDGFVDMLANRRQAYGERLPLLRLQDREAALQGLEARRDVLSAELGAVEQQGDGAALADARERGLAARLERARGALARLEAAADPADSAGEAQRKDAADRLRRVAGALAWEQTQQLPLRLWTTRKEWQQLTKNLAQAHERLQALAKAQQEEPRRFETFSARIDALQQRIQALKPRVEQLIVQQRLAVQELAVVALEQQKLDLLAYASQARFAVAQIYDRATVPRPAAAPGAGAPAANPDGAAAAEPSAPAAAPPAPPAPAPADGAAPAVPATPAPPGAPEGATDASHDARP
jgi:hypothetical protein